MNRVSSKHAGFVLIELLLVVALLVVTFSIAAPNASGLKYSFEQATLDAYAKTVFESAQNKISHMYLSGQSEYLTTAQRGKVTDKSGDITMGHSLYYVTSEDADAKLFFDVDIDIDWVIEYDAEDGIVLGVLVAEEGKGIDFYKSKINKSDNSSNFSTYRHYRSDEYKEFSNDNDFIISYYGNAINNTSTCQAYFCYYEEYIDGTYGYYAFPGYNKLQEGKVVVGDGYGFIVNKEEYKDKVNLVINSQTYGATNDTTPIELTEGIIYKLPNSINGASNGLSSPDSDGLYSNSKSSGYNNQYYYIDAILNVTAEGAEKTEYWSFCPYTAKSAVASSQVSDKKSLPSMVSIRSARQLNALSNVYSKFYSKTFDEDNLESRLSGVTFNQEVDIDYRSYNWGKYTGKNFTGQLPIGTEWGPFVSKYKGNQHKILNCKFVTVANSDINYSGLFGMVYYATIEYVNVAIDNSSQLDTSYTVSDLSINDADYCGVLAAYVQGSWIHDVTVDGYSINLDLTNAINKKKSNRLVSHWDSEHDNAFVGSFIGFINNPTSSNHSEVTLVSNCKSTNCKIEALGLLGNNRDGVFDTLTYFKNHRYYHIGGFVGGVATLHTGFWHANSVSLSNCYFKGQISTDGVGCGAKYCNVGSFAGAIRAATELTDIEAVVIDSSNNVVDLTEERMYDPYYEYTFSL